MKEKLLFLFAISFCVLIIGCGAVDPPAGVNASDGTSSSIVYVTWDEHPDAVKYYVHRKGPSDSDWVEMGQPETNEYEDDEAYLAEPVPIFEYAVLAVSQYGQDSELSTSDNGSLGFDGTFAAGDDWSEYGFDADDPAGKALWFKASGLTAGTTYYVGWMDFDTFGTYVMDIVVSAVDDTFKSNDTYSGSQGMLIYRGDDGDDYSAERDFVLTAGQSTVYIKVEREDSTSVLPGAFALRVSTNP